MYEVGILSVLPTFWLIIVLVCILGCLCEFKLVQSRKYPKDLRGNLRNLESETVWSPRVDLGEYVGISSVQGPRSYMEDTYQVERNLLSHHAELLKTRGIKNEVIISRIAQLQTEQSPCAVFSVFDGHGGRRASEFCAVNFVEYLASSPHLLTQPARALRDTYKALDDKWLENAEKYRWDDGTTAVSAVVLDGRIFVANAGDSRAVLCTHEGQGVALSYDHKPARIDERDRIHRLGGRILFNGGWRVQGILAVTRAIGDVSLKPYVTSEPDVIVHELTAGDLYLILASDGVWDVLSNDEACRLAVSAPDPKAAAAAVVRTASAKGSQDNITALVIDMRPYYSNARSRKANLNAAHARRNSGGENMVRAVSKPSMTSNQSSPLSLQINQLTSPTPGSQLQPMSPVSPPSPKLVTPTLTLGRSNSQLFLNRASPLSTQATTSTNTSSSSAAMITSLTSPTVKPPSSQCAVNLTQCESSNSSPQETLEETPPSLLGETETTLPASEVVSTISVAIEVSNISPVATEMSNISPVTTEITNISTVAVEVATSAKVLESESKSTLESTDDAVHPVETEKQEQSSTEASLNIGMDDETHTHSSGVQTRSESRGLELDCQ